MPTLEELLQGKDPEQLKLLLNSASKSPSPPQTDVEETNDDMVEKPDQKLSVPPIGPGGIMPPGQSNSAPQLAAKEEPKSEEQSKEDDTSSNKLEELIKKLLAAQQAQATELNKGFTNNTVDALKKVQDEVMQDKQNARLTNAMNLIGTSIAGLGSKAVLKNTLDDYYKDLEKDQTKLTNFQALTEKEKDDPKSQASLQTTALGAELLKKAGFEPNLIKGMSFNQVEKNFPTIAKMMEVKTSADARLEAAKQKASDKKTADQDKSLKDTQNLMEQMRGNPAVQQAETALYNAQKLDSLIGDNPDKLSPQQAQLAIMEVSKMATGGVPSQEEMRKLQSGALPERFAGLWQQISNKPKPANAGDFLKQYQDYSNKIRKDAQGVITDRYGRILETRKGKLASDDYKSLQDNYINRFKKPEEAAEYPKTVINKKTGQQATVSNEKELKEANDEGFQ